MSFVTPLVNGTQVLSKKLAKVDAALAEGKLSAKARGYVRSKRACLAKRTYDWIYPKSSDVFKKHPDYVGS